jgi:hypothetical protein
MRLNLVPGDQPTQPVTSFIATNDARQRDASPKSRSDHRDCCRAAQSVFFFVHANDNARLFRIEFRGIADQVAIQD